MPSVADSMHGSSPAPPTGLSMGTFPDQAAWHAAALWAVGPCSAAAMHAAAMWAVGACTMVLACSSLVGMWPTEPGWQRHRDPHACAGVCPAQQVEC